MSDNESGSLYDQFATHEAPAQPESRRVRDWQASKNEETKAYKANLPPHVADAMTVHQKDLSYYEFQKFAFGHNSIDSFGASVNRAFGAIDRGASFISERERYRALYKKMLNKIGE